MGTLLNVASNTLVLPLASAATLRQKLQIKLANSPNHSIPTTGPNSPGADPPKPGLLARQPQDIPNFKITNVTRFGKKIQGKNYSRTQGPVSWRPTTVK